MSCEPIVPQKTAEQQQLEQQRARLFGKVSDIPPTKWIIEGIATEQGLTVLYGDRSAGKTTLSMQILDAINSKERLFGLKVNKVGAFLLEQDESPRIFRNHRDRVLKELPTLEEMELPKVFVTWDVRKNDFTNLVDLIRAYPAKLVIIDSFTSLGIPDINHPNTSAILDRLRQINTEEDCSIILLHHLNRKKEILGSITLQIKADSLIELTNTGLKFHKLRGELATIEGDTLPIAKTGKSILFNLPLAQRARMLVANPKAKEILGEEYPDSSKESIRVTLSKAKSPQIVESTT